MTAFLVLALLQPAKMAEAIEKADLGAARAAIAATVAKDDAASARALLGAFPKLRDRFRLMDRALADARKALYRYETQPAITAADRKEQKEGIEAAKTRLKAVAAMMRETEDIHNAVRAAFRSLKSDEALAAVGDEMEKSAFWLARCEMAEALGTMSQADGERRLRERLAREKEPTVAAAIIDALGAKGTLEASTVAAVAEQLTSKGWTVQMTVARALAASGAKEGVGPLVEAVQKTDGRIRNEMLAALRTLTRTDMGGDVGEWASWWKANKDDFLAGTYRPDKPKREPGPSRTTFFEVPVISRRIVLVVDRSRSMRDPLGKGPTRKIDAVRAEIKALLTALPDGTRFNLIFFNDETAEFAQSTRVLDARVRQAAIDWTWRMDPDGPTNLHDALDKAAALVGSSETGLLREEGVDTLFVLSDGEPTTGPIVDPDVIVKRFTRENRWMRAAVYTVAVGDVGTLMSRLAEFNDGTSTQK